jgi:hypothetical protein
MLVSAKCQHAAIAEQDTTHAQDAVNHASGFPMEQHKYGNKKGLHQRVNCSIDYIECIVLLITDLKKANKLLLNRPRPS